MAGYTYIVRCPATSQTAAKTLIQIASGAAPIEILSAKVMQVTKTTSELLNLQILRKSGAASVTSYTPLKLATLDPTSLAVGGAALTGYNASGEGTDTDILEDDIWNVLNGSWTYLPVPEDRIWMPPSAFLGLKLNTAPGASMSIAAWIRYREYRG